MANSIAQTIVLFGLPTAIIFTGTLLIILIVGLFFYLQKGRKVDALELLFKEMVALAKINYEPHMLWLYRTPSEKGSEGAYPVVLKGKIVGYNRINLYTSFDELYQPSTKKGGGYSIHIDEQEYLIPEKEVKTVKDMISKCGDFLNVIVYETDMGWRIPLLSRNIVTNAVLCFDDQVSGLSSIDGQIILHAPGTESHGCYFEIPSGSRDRTKVVMGVIETLTWIRMNSISLSNIFNVADQSLSINPNLNQILAMKYADQNVKEPPQG